MKLSRHISKIVVLRALQLGDLLCAVPALRALRAAYPSAEIALVGLPWASAFVERFRHIFDRLIEFPGFPGLPERPPRTEEFPAFLESIQRRRFDLALQLHGSGDFVNPLCALFGAAQIAGYCTAGGYCPDPKTFMIYPEGLPEIRRHLRLLEFLGIPAADERLEFPLAARDYEEYLAICSAHSLRDQQCFCVHPGSRSPLRRWPVEDFADVTNRVAAHGLHPVLTGTEEERDLCDRLASLLACPSTNLAGRTSLGCAAALLQHVRLLICNDTGVSHIAAALRVPSVVLFTGSEPERWAPLDSGLHRAVRATPFSAASRRTVLQHAEAFLQLEALYA